MKPAQFMNLKSKNFSLIFNWSFSVDPEFNDRADTRRYMYTDWRKQPGSSNTIHMYDSDNLSQARLSVEVWWNMFSVLEWSRHLFRHCSSLIEFHWSEKLFRSVSFAVIMYTMDFFLRKVMLSSTGEKNLTQKFGFINFGKVICPYYFW